MGAFIQEGKMPVDKDWFTMAVSRETISLEHSNSKDGGTGPGTHVLGDICFMNFNTVSLMTLSNPHNTREMTLPKTVRRGINNLAVNGITDLASLLDKNVRKDLWKLINGIGRRQWGGYNLA